MPAVLAKLLKLSTSAFRVSWLEDKSYGHSLQRRNLQMYHCLIFILINSFFSLPKVLFAPPRPLNLATLIISCTIYREKDADKISCPFDSIQPAAEEIYLSLY